MGQVRKLQSEQRERVLMIAHVFDANYSMESRLSWFRAIYAAQDYEVTVLCVEPYGAMHHDTDPVRSGLDVITVRHTTVEKLLMCWPLGFYFAYRLWHWRVFRRARRLHAERGFSLVHQVSYCGYREPGYCWRLGIPFVWGPVGGTQNVPWRFFKIFNAPGACKEALRNILNKIQLRFSRRVRYALRTPGAVLVANREVQDSFRKILGADLTCQLETGIERVADQPRPLRDKQQPLRVLWTGRLENWKALPLLLRAVAELPAEFALELRIVGSGSQTARLKQLASQLGIEQKLEWIPLPPCGARDEYYQWADVFAFTSLRDTSGTGLLESLAAGVPIIGLNHQGARDIMTTDCAVPIEVNNPRQVIADFQAALVQLAQDAKLLQRLSDGAFSRAQGFLWQRLYEKMNEVYSELLVSSKSAPAVQLVDREPVYTKTATTAGYTHTR